MKHAEKYLHEKFASKRHRGEWFALSDDEAAWVTALTAEHINVLLAKP